MKKLIFVFIIVILVGCQQNNTPQVKTTQIKTEQTNCEAFKTYHEFSNIYDAAKVKCGNDENCYFENVEVNSIDKDKNRLLVIIRNSENKKYTAWVQFKELPTHIPEKINIKVGPHIKESSPPILDGIEIYDTNYDEISYEKQYEFYNEYSNVFEGAIVECNDQEKYHFQKVEVINFDRKNNLVLVTLRNSQNKRCSAYVAFQELPWNVPRYANITVGPFIRESFPPILDGIEIEPYTEK